MRKPSPARITIPRPLFPEHMPTPRMPRIGWTAAERKAAEAFLLRLDIITERLEATEQVVAA